MKIKAIQLYCEYDENPNCLIIGFSNGNAVCLLENGEIHNYCYSHIRIVDEEYLSILKEQENG